MEDRINLHQLMELKAAFERADTDQGGSLDMEEFLEAFGGVLGENLTTTQLIHLFMKIDANSDGSVDWDEFTQFMLLENQAAADMSDRSFAVRYMEQDPRLCDPNPKSVHHRDMIEQILLIGKGTQQEKLVTSARDGTVRVWNASTLAHVKTIKVSESSWITDCKYFGASNRLAVACVDRSVYLYDNGSYDEATRVALSGVDTSPLSLGTWRRARSAPGGTGQARACPSRCPSLVRKTLTFFICLRSTRSICAARGTALLRHAAPCATARASKNSPRRTSFAEVRSAARTLALHPRASLQLRSTQFRSSAERSLRPALSQPRARD